MTTDLEEQLTRSMAQAVEETSLPHAAPVGAVRALQRRRGRRRTGFAAAWAVAAATAVVLTGTQLVAPEPQQQPAASPHRIPDFVTLPPPEKVWPDAVHRLPPVLPDGSRYVVAAVLGDGRYLVHTGWGNGKGNDPAPSVFDTETGTVTRLGGPNVGNGMDWSRVQMARMVEGKAVWVLAGRKSNKPDVGELWAAPLDGSLATRLANFSNGSGSRFSSAGATIFWGQREPGQLPSGGFPTSIRSVPLSGGRVVTVKGARNFEPTYGGPWITSQNVGSMIVAKTSGELRNLETGKRLRWKAAPGVDDVVCGPTWCVGHGEDRRFVLQALDGSGQVKLPAGVWLSPADDGRFAVGGVELANGERSVLWDRTTGRAATYWFGPKVNESGLPVENLAHTADFKPEVLTVGLTDDALVILDLAAIK